MDRRARWTAGLCLAIACGDDDVMGSGSSATDDGAMPTSTTSSPSADGSTSAATSITSADDTSGTTIAPGESTQGDRSTSTTGDGTSESTTNATSRSEGSASTSDGSSTTDATSSSDASSSSESSSSTDGSSSSDASTSEPGGTTSIPGYTCSASTSSDTGLGSETGSGSTGPADPCGNGVLDLGEVCDDGNDVGGDGCEPDCTSSDDVQPIWTLELGGATGYVDCGTGVAFDCDGNLIVAAYTEPDVIWIRKYDPSYVELWTVTYPGVPGAAPCPMTGVATDAEGNVGFIGEVTLDVDVFLGMLDSGGAELWTETVSGTLMIPATDYAGSIAFDPGGDLLVTAGLGAGTASDIWVAKYDALGGLVWDDMYDAAGNADSGRGIASDADGNVLVTGNAHSGSDHDILVRKYDPDGAVQWTDIVSGSPLQADFGWGVAALGNALVAGGIIREVPMNGDGWLRMYQADGTVQWTQTYEGTAAATGDGILDVAAAADGTVLIAGGVADNDGQKAWIARTNSNGAIIWERRRFDPSSWRAVAVAPDGRVAVAGVIQLPFPWDAEARFAVYPP